MLAKLLFTLYSILGGMGDEVSSVSLLFLAVGALII